MPSLPTGTVTFLFTDIEGSTRLLRQLGDRYAQVLADYHQLLLTASQSRGGQEVDTQGDAVFLAFPRAIDALIAAVAAQRSLLSHQWPDGISIRVRMGLHTGEPLHANTGYVGMDVHRAARICAAGHGGQILLSETTQVLVADSLPDGVSLRDLGKHRLKDLTHPQHIFQAVITDLPADFQSLKSIDVLPSNLPGQLTSFIGRDREMAEVKRLLSTARLVTFTGIGGAGKTRLALQVAADALEEFKDGVWVAELAPLSDPGLVPKAVAAALGLPEPVGRSPIETLVDYLQPRSLLLVLDNCEHLLPACAQLAKTLLGACPHVRIVATSREALDTEGETRYRVPSLSVPDSSILSLERLGEFEAVRLFVDRATDARPSFVMDAHNAMAVATICRELDGIPLAIELAAARVKALSVEHIAERLHDRFRLLTSGKRTALPGHQTLRAAMDWSHDLLSDPERVMLRRLSVFAGGFTLEAAEVVCDGQGVNATDVIDLQTRLVEKSLVVFYERDGRYGMLETVRQYGREKLLDSGEEAAVRGKHRDWYLGLAEQAELELRGPRQKVRLDQLEAEHDNMRTALEWSRTDGSGAEQGLRLAGALWWFWFLHGHWNEARGWLGVALARGSDVAGAIRAKALRGAGCFAYLGDTAEARPLNEEGLALSRELGDNAGVAWFLGILGIVAMREVDYQRSSALLEESLALSRELKDKWLIAQALAQTGVLALFRGDVGRSASDLTQCVAMMRELRDHWGVAFGLRALGSTALSQRDIKQAAAYFKESLSWGRGIDYGYAVQQCLEGLATVASVQGHHQQAARLLGAAEAQREILGLDLAPQWLVGHDRTVASLRVALEEDALTTAWSEGGSMTLKQAIEYALSEDG